MNLNAAILSAIIDKTFHEPAKITLMEALYKVSKDKKIQVLSRKLDAIQCLQDKTDFPVGYRPINDFPKRLPFGKRAAYDIGSEATKQQIRLEFADKRTIKDGYLTLLNEKITKKYLSLYEKMILDMMKKGLPEENKLLAIIKGNLQAVKFVYTGLLGNHLERRKAHQNLNRIVENHINHVRSTQKA